MKKLFEASGWIVFFLFLSGCATIDRAKKTFNENPGAAADYCAEKFPVRSYTADPVFTNKPANNESYQAKIDSLFDLAGALASKLYADSVLAAERLAAKLPVDTAKLAQDVRYYKQLTKSLTDKIFELNSKYKPCKPDTVEKKITVYTENTARVDALLFERAEQAAEIKKLKADLADAQHKATKRAIILWSLVALFLVCIYLRIKGIL